MLLSSLFLCSFFIHECYIKGHARRIQITDSFKFIDDAGVQQGYRCDFHQNCQVLFLKASGHLLQDVSFATRTDCSPENRVTFSLVDHVDIRG